MKLGSTSEKEYAGQIFHIERLQEFQVIYANNLPLRRETITSHPLSVLCVVTSFKGVQDGNGGRQFGYYAK